MSCIQRTSCFLLCILLLCACDTTLEASPTPTISPASQPALLYLRADSPGGEMEMVLRRGLADPGRVLSYHPPADCAIWGLHPAPRGLWVAIELDCGNGMTVLQLDLETETASLPAEAYGTDARFLAWMPDGEQLYLQVDTLGDPKVIQVEVSSGRSEILPFPATLDDLAVMPDGQSVLYATSRGMGPGSELWLAELDGSPLHRLIADPDHLVARARPSPRGDRIAYILMPDSQVPFTVGQLWVMDADGGNAHLLGDADAGHGYAPVWSSDGKQVAIVVRDNPDDAEANTSAGALVSNLSVLDAERGEESYTTDFHDGYIETPTWSPDSSALVFNFIGNGTIIAWVSNLVEETLQPLDKAPFSCCAVYLADE